MKPEYITTEAAVTRLRVKYGLTITEHELTELTTRGSILGFGDDLGYLVEWGTVATFYADAARDCTSKRRLYRVSEYCALTGAAPQTVRGQLREGRLRGRKDGGRWKVFASAVGRA